MRASLRVTIRPHWFGAWFIRPLARPIVVVDGTEHPAPWGMPLCVSVDAAKRNVAVGLRYRGTRALLGLDPIRVTAGEGEEKALLARNGPLNHQAFSISEGWIHRMYTATFGGQDRVGFTE